MFKPLTSIETIESTRGDCLRMGLDLAVIRSKSEINFIQSSFNSSYTFIGAECLQSNNHTYIKNTDGSSIIRNNWLDKECGCGVAIVGNLYTNPNDTSKFTTVKCDAMKGSGIINGVVCVSPKPFYLVTNDQTGYLKKFHISIVTFTTLNFVLIVLIFILVLCRRY